MTDKQPQTTEDAAAELRRLHAESEMRRTALLDEMQKAAQQHAELETLRAGYTAARLEIESLRAGGAEPAGEYPLLPEPVGKVEVSTTLEKSGLRRHKASPAYTSDQRRAYVDRAMRAEQPAGAQQPGAAYAALPDEAYCDLQYAVDALDAIAKRQRQVADVIEPVSDIRHAAKLAQEGASRLHRAIASIESHGQAPAQAAPAYKDSTPELHIGDSAFESWYSSYSPAHKTDKQRARDAYAAGMGDPLVTAVPAAVAGCTRSHPHENMDSACRAKAAIAEMQNKAARGAEATAHDLDRFVVMLTSAPTTQPAPQQETSPTTGMNIAQRILHVGGRNNAAGYVEFGSIQAVEALVRQVLRDLPSAPQPSPTAQAAPAAVAVPDEIDRLRAALVYVAFALHDARQYMLAEGITLIDGDTVRVSRDGWTVEASSNPLRQPAPQPSPAAQGDALDAAKQCLEMGESFRALRRVVSLLLEARRNLGPEDHELRDRIDQLLRADAARAAQEGKSHD